MTDTRIIDQSGDKDFFVITPQIVWAIARDPYDYTLWNVIKMIAGDKGECILSTDDLAALAMMSAGKVSDCRKYLIEQGVLEGEFRQDPGYPQPVWHLTIPNLWKMNVEWREKNSSLKARIAMKKEQRQGLKAQRSAKKQAKHNSLHQMKPSPGEGGVTPDEGGVTPDETKKNQQEEPKEDPALPTQNNGSRSSEPNHNLFSELATLLKTPKTLMTPKMTRAYDNLVMDLEEMGASAGDIDAFGEWWYANDWRGQKGQKPTLAHVREYWSEFLDFKRGVSPAIKITNEPGRRGPKAKPLTPEQQAAYEALMKKDQT